MSGLSPAPSAAAHREPQQQLSGSDAAGGLAQGVAGAGFLARRIIQFQPPGMQRRRPQVEDHSEVEVPRRKAVQHRRRLNWLALLIERQLLGKFGQLDLAEREQAVAQTLDGAAHDLVARPRSVYAPSAADEVEIHRQRAL